MQYVTLGKTGLRISRVGFGGIPLQRISAEEGIRIFDTLAETGINYIDTARGYTISEEYIGRAIEGRRDRFVLATKSPGVTKEAMAADIEISLKNLRTDYIDLYQVHNPSMENFHKIIAPGGAADAMLEAKAQGKIGHLGLTTHSLEIFEEAMELPWVETLMFPYNIVETQAEELIRRCAEKNIGFIAMKPLAGGAIENADLAMRYICGNPAVTVVIPGMAAEAEVRQNAAAAEKTAPLDEAELAEVEAIRRELGENFCRRCNYCAPCTEGIAISNVFLFQGYLRRYGLGDWAVTRYNAMDKYASDCIECGACEERCPYHLPIRAMLKKAAEDFKH